MKRPKTPTLEKISKVSSESTAIGFFVVWLKAQGYTIAITHEHTPECQGEDGFNHCGAHSKELVPLMKSTHDLIYDYYGIDRNQEDKERRALLEYIRQARS